MMFQIIQRKLASLWRGSKKLFNGLVRLVKNPFVSLYRLVVHITHIARCAILSLRLRAAIFVLSLLNSVAIWATGTGAGGFTKAATEISSYQTPVSNLMKAIAAVIVLVGAFNVFFKLQNGDQDVKKTIII